jgi:hypothetical protein
MFTFKKNGMTLFKNKHLNGKDIKETKWDELLQDFGSEQYILREMSVATNFGTFLRHFFFFAFLALILRFLHCVSSSGPHLQIQYQMSFNELSFRELYLSASAPNLLIHQMLFCTVFLFLFVKFVSLFSCTLWFKLQLVQLWVS